MACLRGYIEVFDANSFESRAKWHNDLKSMQVNDKKAQGKNKLALGEEAMSMKLDDWVVEENLKQQAMRRMAAG